MLKFNVNWDLFIYLSYLFEISLYFDCNYFMELWMFLNSLFVNMIWKNPILFCFEIKVIINNNNNNNNNNGLIRKTRVISNFMT